MILLKEMQDIEMSLKRRKLHETSQEFIMQILCYNRPFKWKLYRCI